MHIRAFLWARFNAYDGVYRGLVPRHSIHALAITICECWCAQWPCEWIWDACITYRRRYGSLFAALVRKVGLELRTGKGQWQHHGPRTDRTDVYHWIVARAEAQAKHVLSR